jgi:hypothetical protein
MVDAGIEMDGEFVRKYGRKDANHDAVVKALRQAGASVQSLADIGGGCPDILVARRNQMWLIEIKDGSLPPSKRALTKDEAAWHNLWYAPVYVASSVSEALEIIGIIVPSLATQLRTKAHDASRKLHPNSQAGHLGPSTPR